MRLRERVDRLLGLDIEVPFTRAKQLRDENEVRRGCIEDGHRRLGHIRDEIGELRASVDSQPEATQKRLAELATEGDRLADEVDRQLADWERCSGEITSLLDEVDAKRQRMRRATVRIAQTNVLLQVVTGLIGLLLVPLASNKAASTIHLDYYSAVATIIPVLLVAGFVELAVLSVRAAMWAVLSFAIPATGGLAAALIVLASHHSTVSTLYFTIWGLIATGISLVAYIGEHATMTSRESG